MGNLTPLNRKLLTVSEIKISLAKGVQKLSNFKSIQDVLESELPSFAKCKKYHLVEEVKRYVILLIIQLNKSFSENQQMSEEQVKMVASEVINDYYMLNIADLRIAFNQLKREKLFGGLSPNVIYNKLEDYTNERGNVAEQNSRNKDLDKSISKQEVAKCYKKIKMEGVLDDDQDLAKKKDIEYMQFCQDYNNKKARQQIVFVKSLDPIYTRPIR